MISVSEALQCERDMDFGGRRVLGVELLQRGLQDLRALRIASASPPSALAPSADRSGRRARQLNPFDHFSAADLEDLHDGAGGADLDAERVAIAEAGAGHLLLPLLQRLDRAQRVAQLRRLLEPLGGGRVGHALAQLAHQLVVAPFEEQPRVLHRDRVGLLGADLAHAGGDAAADVVLQARPGPIAGNHFVARPDAEQPVGQRHGPASELRRHERAGVVVVVLLDAPRDQDARERLARRELQVGVVLVVAQQDVVARRPLLDEVILERQRLDHRIGDDELEPRRFVEQRVDARAHPLRPQVAADAVAQHPGLADVQRVPRLVEIEVDPRLLGQAGDPALEVLDRHGLHWAFLRAFEPKIIAAVMTRYRPHREASACSRFARSSPRAWRCGSIPTS